MPSTNSDLFRRVRTQAVDDGRVAQLTAELAAARVARATADIATEKALRHFNRTRA